MYITEKSTAALSRVMNTENVFNENHFELEQTNNPETSSVDWKKNSRKKQTNKETKKQVNTFERRLLWNYLSWIWE